MLSVSNSFKRKLYNDERDYSCEAEITLADGTELTVGNDYIMSNGFEIENAVSDDNSFNALGGTVIGSAQLILYNNDEIYSDYDFKNAEVILFVSLDVEINVNDQIIVAPEKLQLGIFTVDEASYGSSTITLSMLDNMEKFDRPYSLSGLSYPATLEEIVQDACLECGVLLASSSANFPNKSYIVETGPDIDNTTFRDVLGYVGTIAGCFAMCNVNGELDFRWFNTAVLEDTEHALDGGTFEPWTTGTTTDGGTFSPWSTGTTVDGGAFTDTIVPHYINALYSQNMAVDDVVITGVKMIVTDESEDGDQTTETFLSGTEDYCIVVENNPFITVDTAQTVLTYLTTLLVGLRFRKCEITQSNDPSIEAGDVGFVWDTKGVEHPILITRTNFSPKSPQTIVCGAETPSRNNATRFSSETKAVVDERRLAKKRKSRYDLAMQALERKINNSSGLYETQEIQPDQSVKTYLHNKPTLADSDIQIAITTAGVTVTPDGGDHWYGLTVDGQLLASIIQTINLFFDYAHGGTITLGGRDDGNGKLVVYNSSGSVIGTFDNTGINITRGIIKGPDIYTKGTARMSSSTTGAWIRLNNGRITVYYSPLNSTDPITNGTEYYRIGIDESAVCYDAMVTTGGYGRTKFRWNINSSLVDFLEIYRRDTTTYTNPAVIEINGCIQLPQSGTHNGIYWTYYPGAHSPRYTIGLEPYVDSGGTEYNYLNFTCHEVYISGAIIQKGSNSSKRYKHDIKPLEKEILDPHRLLSLNAVQFIYNEEVPLQYDDMRGQTIPGFIAEDVDKIYPAAVIHKEDGSIESWDERRIIPGMLSLIQEQRKEIDELTERVKNLESKLETVMKYLEDSDGSNNTK